MRTWMSLSMLQVGERTLPRKMKCGTIVSFWPSTVKIGTSGRWDDCCTMIWVLDVLTLSPRALYIEVTTFSARCRASGV